MTCQIRTGVCTKENAKLVWFGEYVYACPECEEVVHEAQELRRICTKELLATVKQVPLIGEVKAR